MSLLPPLFLPQPRSSLTYPWGLRGGRGGVHFKDQLVSASHWLSGKLTQTGLWSGVTQGRALGWTRYKSVVLVIACEMTE